MSHSPSLPPSIPLSIRSLSEGSFPSVSSGGYCSILKACRVTVIPVPALPPSLTVISSRWMSGLPKVPATRAMKSPRWLRMNGMSFFLKCEMRLMEARPTIEVIHR